METVSTQVGPYNLTVFRDDMWVSTTLRSGQEWEGWMRSDLPWLVRPGEDIIDVGGNIGWNSLMFSEYSPVHVFEPVYHEIIQKNISQNNTKHPVTLHPYGLLDENSSFKFYFPGVSPGGLFNAAVTSIYKSNYCCDQFTTCPVKRLDDVYQGVPCLIKIDVEGAELGVIKGAERIIRTHRPHLYVEIFDIEGPIPKLLKEWGYEHMLKRPEDNYLFVGHVP